jgi:hypothetical protein
MPVLKGKSLGIIFDSSPFKIPYNSPSANPGRSPFNTWVLSISTATALV